VTTRRSFALAFLAVVALGLASRRFPAIFPALLGKYPGDALWAVMVFCLWGFFVPAWSTGKLAVSALLTSYADEFSQIYQASWINQIRATTVGHLVLGSAFSWFDMLAYTVGVAAAALCNEYARRRA
jgi:uncharacterized protein DUF2809